MYMLQFIELATFHTYYFKYIETIQRCEIYLFLQVGMYSAKEEIYTKIMQVKLIMIMYCVTVR